MWIFVCIFLVKINSKVRIKFFVFGCVCNGCFDIFSVMFFVSYKDVGLYVVCLLMNVVMVYVFV